MLPTHRLVLVHFVIAFGAIVNLPFAQSDATGGFPYNPDSDNNGTIEVNDLLVFLPYYGANFNVNPEEWEVTERSSGTPASM